ncbi:MAG: PAS domain S-box protein [Chryseosolibacter sp.]
MNQNAVSDVPQSKISFLSGGGEMGERTRAFDWSQTSLGPVEKWPQSLLTTLSIILNSRFPMFLFWGPDLVCFYNDAYRPSLGNDGKHPFALGKRGEEVWPEIWHIIKPLIDEILSGGDASWSEDQLIPIFRNAAIEDVYWTFSYSPVKDESGMASGIFVTCIETTDKVVAKRQLEESKDLLHFAIEATELGTWDYDPLQNKLSGNDRLKEWFGLENEDGSILESAIKAIKPSDRPRVTSAIQTALEFSSGGKYDTEYTIVHTVTGEEKFVRAVGRAWFDDKGVAYRFNGTLQDITERKRAEIEQLKQIALIENSHDFIGISDLDGNAVFVNEAGQKMIGLNGSDSVRRTNILDYFPAEEKEYVQSFVLPKVLKDGSWSGDTWFRNFKNGEIVPMTWNVFLMKDRITGENMGFGCVSQNQTERKKAELASKESEERFRSLADQSPMIVYIVEPTHEASMSYFNKTWLDYTGQRYEDALGRAWDGIVHPDDVPGILEIYAPAFRERKHYTLPAVRLRRYDGVYRYFYFKGSPRFLRDGEFIGFVGVGIDIHDQKLSEFKLRESEEMLEKLVRERTMQLERSNEDLQQFAHVASHDLKEPVRKIKTFASRIREEAQSRLTDRELNYIEKVQSAANRMSSMIDGVLLYSTMNSIEQKIEKVDLNRTIKEITNDLEILIHHKSAVFDIAELPVIEGANILIYQLFYNLINNSLKFSKPDQQLTISISAEKYSSAQKEYVRIELADDGIGFEPEHAENIFNTFTRLNSKDKYEGTGLGLALCRKIVMRHQGSIAASGAVGKGSTFTITLPVLQEEFSI